MSDIRKSPEAPEKIANILKDIPAEVIEGTTTCGWPFPPDMEEDIRVLVLGCGTGRDAYIASRLIGEGGIVWGVDTDPEKIAIAKKNAPANCRFFAGDLEDLIAIPDGQIDLVLANCAISQPLHTQKVINEIWRVLSFGGELFLCDMFCDRRMPADKFMDPEMRAAGLSSALYIEDFRRFTTNAGFLTVRNWKTVKSKLGDDELSKQFEGITYFNRTMRTWKIPEIIEDLCEQYNQFATYQGGIDGYEDEYVLDPGHVFVKGEPLSVCGNSMALVQNTRVAKYFTFEGNRNENFGPYPGCGNIPYSADEE